MLDQKRKGQAPDDGRALAVGVERGREPDRGDQEKDRNAVELAVSARDQYRDRVRKKQKGRPTRLPRVPTEPVLGDPAKEGRGPRVRERLSEPDPQSEETGVPARQPPEGGDHERPDGAVVVSVRRRIDVLAPQSGLGHEDVGLCVVVAAELRGDGKPEDQNQEEEKSGAPRGQREGPSAGPPLTEPSAQPPEGTSRSEEVSPLRALRAASAAQSPAAACAAGRASEGSCH